MRQRRAERVRSRIRGTQERPRLTVFRSARRIYVQLIDDVARLTLAHASDSELGAANEKSSLGRVGSLASRASLVGKAIAEVAGKKRITRVVFDRGGYAYHGAVKALADGAREGGLQF